MYVQIRVHLYYENIVIMNEVIKGTVNYGRNFDQKFSSQRA